MIYSERDIPTREALRQFSKVIPEINAAAVELLLHFLQTSFEIQHRIFDVLERNHKISEGKLVVMIILYQLAPGEGLPPSQLAAKACVTRATISAMLQRMLRDGLAFTFSNHDDGRGKLVALTPQGRSFTEEILPDHFLRINRLMSGLTGEEQQVLIELLKKIKVT